MKLTVKNIEIDDTDISVADRKRLIAEWTKPKGRQKPEMDKTYYFLDDDDACPLARQPFSIEDWETRHIDGSTSDGYHTFDELYEYRMLYNAMLFKQLAESDARFLGTNFNVHKSKRHSNGEECFGGGWFIVMATLPTGQISNHYNLEHWDLFQCEARERADEWDGHTPADAADRMRRFLEGK